MRITIPLILASQSPRRRRLLRRLGVTFTVQVSPADEVIPDDAVPDQIVQTLALQKARPVAAQHLDALTLAADTIVALGNEILEKPASEQEARQMLWRLSGATHTVYTGIGLVHPSTARETTAVEATNVTFGALTEEEIAAYVDTGSPMDKAGSYGIQDDLGALFVERIEGDYYNVVGLPLRRLYVTLRDTYGDLLSLRGRSKRP